MAKLLVVNADDFGFSQGINRRIIEAHRHGIVTSASLVITAPRIHEAVAMSRGCPNLTLPENLSPDCVKVFLDTDCRHRRNGPQQPREYELCDVWFDGADLLLDSGSRLSRDIFGVGPYAAAAQVSSMTAGRRTSGSRPTTLTLSSTTIQSASSS